MHKTRARTASRPRMARNGCNVLHTMLSAARKSAKGVPRAPLPAKEVNRMVRKLQRELAWLPAYDRRDVVIV